MNRSIVPDGVVLHAAKPNTVMSSVALANCQQCINSYISEYFRVSEDWSSLKIHFN